MHPYSSLSEQQREAAVVLFESGHSYSSASTRLGVAKWPVKKLYSRWRIHGKLVLMPKPSKQVYSFESKLDMVQQYLAGKRSAAGLAEEHGLSSPELLKKWVLQYRRGGVDALRPKPRGRPSGSGAPPPLSELDKLRRENERLAAENAYLKKLRALMAQQPR